MATPFHGMSNVLLSAAAETNQSHCRNAFAAVAAFFEHLSTPAGGSYMTRIACYWGTGASGWDRTGGANPAGENAFGVWRLNTSVRRPGGGTELGAIYFFLAWAYSENPSGWLGIGSATYDGAALNGAFREDGGNPWAGTTNNDGTDTLATPLWTAGGSVVHCLCISNNPEGTYATNKNNCFRLFAGNKASAVEHYAHMVADADFIAISGPISTSTDSVRWLFYFSFYNPIENHDDVTYNIVCCSGDGLLNNNQTVGYLTGSSEKAGGIFVSGGSSVSFNLTVPHRVLTSSYQPNPFSAVGVYDEAPFVYYTINGWCGWSDNDYIRAIYGVISEDWDATNERIVLGSTYNYIHSTVPWPDVGEGPGDSRTYDGRIF